MGQIAAVVLRLNSPLEIKYRRTEYRLGWTTLFWNRMLRFQVVGFFLETLLVFYFMSEQNLKNKSQKVWDFIYFLVCLSAIAWFFFFESLLFLFCCWDCFLRLDLGDLSPIILTFVIRIIEQWKVVFHRIYFKHALLVDYSKLLPINFSIRRPMACLLRLESRRPSK